MRTVLVTGCAGFIGSHIAEACLARGDRVIGIDSMTDYYDVDQKWSNVGALQQFAHFQFVNEDVMSVVRDCISGVDVLFHQAGQPGVRESWRTQFRAYLQRNVETTQHVLEAAESAQTPRVVFASSSAVYGNVPTYPVDESERPRPFSPYGVTKLAAEHLCSLYAENFGLSVVSLRYFTVYGPGQRPDMAIYRLIESALAGTPFVLFGDGSQIRDFTFVGDIVRANLAAAEADVPAGLVANVAGGSHCSMTELIETVGAVVGAPVTVEHSEQARGDVRFTSAEVALARRTLGWQPTVALPQGLDQQTEWHRRRRARSVAPND